VFPVDFSVRVEAMVPSVRKWARQFGARVTVLHAFDVIPDCPLSPGFEQRCADGHPELPYTAPVQEARRARKRQLEKFAAERFADLNYGTLIEDGDPATVIEWAVRQGYGDLVIIPSKGWGEFRRLLLGSITAKVLHEVQCPVLMSAPTADLAGATDGYQSIVCGVELDPEADRVLKIAGFLAQQFAARLSVVHVEPPSASTGDEVAATDLLRVKLRQDFAATGIDIGAVKVRVVDTAVEGGIRFAATVEKADLVVVGRGRQRDMLGGFRSHLYAIVRESQCPVLSV
jgi:nucleotide-binding universal stress UspA family protein